MTIISARRRTRLSREARGDQILDSAAKAVLRHGASGVSLEGLARDVGISKALIYGYFRSRDELLAALLRREQRDLRERGMAAALRAETFEVLIRQTTRLYLEQSRDRGALIEALLSDPSVERLMADDARAEHDATVRFFVRAARRAYGLNLPTAMAAVRLLMAVTGEAGRAIGEGTMALEAAEELCVALITGGLGSLALI